MKINDMIRNNLHDRLGIPPDLKPPMGNLKKSEWSDEFEILMRNRLVMGAMRYGKLGAPGKPQYDWVKEIYKRTEKYEKSGNTEFLVDVANMAVVEFVEGDHSNKHFKSIDDGEHAKIKGEV